ncbi:hypothetical protein [Tateyamaria sp.]|uniref:hypothetical protein n=1 Tax=Tateyamaria sp. TaxID=1929288 RepID=UPI00329BC5C5
MGATILTFALSLFEGQDALCSQQDVFILITAAFGLVLWALADTAIYALVHTNSISVVGGSMTVLKAYHNPDTETFSNWMLCCLASRFAIMLGRAVRRVPAMIPAK